MLRGTAPSTTSGPMLSTAPPTARSNSPLKAKWGVERRSARDCRDCPGQKTWSWANLSYFDRLVISKILWQYLSHDGMSLFPCNSIEATQNLQHKRPRGMEAIGQSFFYNTETHMHRHNCNDEHLYVVPKNKKEKRQTSMLNTRKHTETFCRHRRSSLKMLCQWRCPFHP